MGVLMQLIGSYIVCSLTMSTGIIFAWPSSTTTLFKSENTTLYRPISNGESSLLGSLTCAGALVSTPLLSLFVDRLGRKKCAMVCALLNVTGWTMIASSRYVELILTGVFVAGLGGAGFLVAAVFISEFCHETIRGAMSSGTMVMYGAGMLLSYLTGGLLSYWHNVYMCLAICIANLCLLGILKESPLYLLLKGLDEEAAASVAYYRQIDPKSKEVLEELAKLRRTINADNEVTTPEEEKLKPETKKEKLNLWQFFKKSRATRQALFITLTMMTASIFQGLSVVQVYAEPIFTQTIPIMSATTAAVVFALVNVGAGFVAAYLAEVAGRRPLIIYPSIGAAACCVICGLQLHLEFGPNWIMPLFLYIYATFYALGAATVPYVLTAELFLPEVKSYLTMLNVEWNWLCNFLILVIFDPLNNAIGLGPIFYLFAVICVATAIFSLYFVPETKGLPLDEIQKLLVPKRRRSHVKSYLTMLNMEWNWLCIFLILVIFDPLKDAIDLGPIFYIFAVICFLTAIFSIYFVPETKGLPLDEIQKLLVPKRRRTHV